MRIWERRRGAGLRVMIASRSVEADEDEEEAEETAVGVMYQQVGSLDIMGTYERNSARGRLPATSTVLIMRSNSTLTLSLKPSAV